jgi:hypothetical protein
MKRAIEISLRAYRRLLKLYPPTHLAEYGEEMARCFRDLCCDEARRRGIPGLVAAWGFILRDLVGSLIREHRAEGRKAMNRFGELMRRKISDEKLKGLAAVLFWYGAVAVLYGSVFKLTSLPLTEGQLVIGLLCAVAVTLQMTMLGLLVRPARVAPSPKQLEG